MINLSEKAKEICQRLNKEGFRPEGDEATDLGRRSRAVYIQARFSDGHEKDKKYLIRDLDDGGEMTLSQWEAMHRDYASFTADPDLYSIMPEENPYLDMALVSADIHYAFQQAFDAMLRKEFGEDVEITFHEGCSEYEVSRKTAPVVVG